MAAKPKYKPASQYEVELTQPVTVGRQRLLPRPDLKHTIKGSVLETLPPEAIANARETD
ncbi:hypothetical protein [Shinella sp. JR1-6]|uniref:hypothetical protein n=1 Tax=Shinella sp. JR1-6 TaxID=2527671 RepID=UPI00140432F0|nr:hypothetical protein [Shinella sp. JR1-6]